MAILQVRRLQQDVRTMVRAATSSEGASSATDFEAATVDAMATIKVIMAGWSHITQPHTTFDRHCSSRRFKTLWILHHKGWLH